MAGHKLERLSLMEPGHIYLYAETETQIPRTPSHEDLKDSEGNVLYTFVLVSMTVVENDIVYDCDLVEGPEGQSKFRLYETLDQYMIDQGTAVLYKLGNI